MTTRTGLGLRLPAAIVVFVVFVVFVGGALAVASWWGYVAIGWVNANVHAPIIFFWFVYAQVATDMLTLATWLIKWVMRVFPSDAPASAVE